MLSLAIIFLLFFVFYWVKVSHQEHIKSSDIIHFKTKYLSFLPLKHLKLKNGKLRLIIFKKKSKDYKQLMNFLRKENIQIID